MVFTIKKETFKKRPKNQNFPKGLVHAFRQKLELFFWWFLFLNQATKDRFRIFQIENNGFYT